MIASPGADNPADRTIGSPVFMRGQDKAPVRPAPDLGQHNDAVMAELGYTPSDIAALRAAGVLQ